MKLSDRTTRIDAQAEVRPKPPQDIRREEILLPQLPPAIIRVAKTLADCIGPWLTSEKSLPSFEAIARHVKTIDSKRISGGNITKIENTELTVEVALTITLVQLRSPRSPFPIKGIPSGLFDGESPAAIKRSAVAAQYLLTHCAKPRLRTAREAEQLAGTKKLLHKYRLQDYFPYRNPEELVAVAFPDMIIGEDPPIRPWLTAHPKKWTRPGVSEKLADNALTWAFKYCHPAFMNGEEEAHLVHDRLKLTQWQVWFEDHHLIGMVDRFFARSTPKAVERGLNLTSSVLLENVELPKICTVVGSWNLVNPDGTMRIDGTTARLFQKLSRIYPNCFTEGDPGKPLPTILAKVKDWTGEYREIDSHAIPSSKIYVWEAIYRVFPSLFGFEDGKSSPFSETFVGIWDGAEGIRRFCWHFAHRLNADGLGSYDAVDKSYGFSYHEFRTWLERKRQELPSSCANAAGLRTIMNNLGLSGPLRIITRSNVNHAFSILLKPGLAGSALEGSLLEGSSGEDLPTMVRNIFASSLGVWSASDIETGRSQSRIRIAIPPIHLLEPRQLENSLYAARKQSCERIGTVATPQRVISLIESWTVPFLKQIPRADIVTKIREMRSRPDFLLLNQLRP